MYFIRHVKTSIFTLALAIAMLCVSFGAAAIDSGLQKSVINKDPGSVAVLNEGIGVITLAKVTDNISDEGADDAPIAKTSEDVSTDPTPTGICSGCHTETIVPAGAALMLNPEDPGSVAVLKSRYSSRGTQ